MMQTDVQLENDKFSFLANDNVTSEINIDFQIPINKIAKAIDEGNKMMTWFIENFSNFEDTNTQTSK